MSKPRRFLLRALAAASVPVLLAACTTEQPQAPVLRPIASGPPAIDPRLADTSVYGLYLAGEAALDDGANREAAIYLSQASARRPDAAFLKERAFAAALVSGDVERAAALAPKAGEGDEAAYGLGRVTQAVVDLADGRGKAAYDLLASSGMGAHWAAATLLTPWAAAAAGDWNDATAPVSSASSDHAVQAFGQLDHALLLERAGKFSEAESAYQIMSARGGVFSLAYGAFLERRGRRDAALVIYGQSLAKDPTDPAFTAAKARAASNAPAPPAPTIRTGAAEALIGPAALLLAQKQPDAGLAYLRLALKLDPNLAEAWVLVGDALDAQQDTAGSREAYHQVKPDSAEYTTAQGRLALSLQEAGQKDEALAVAEAAASSHPNDPHTLLVLSDLYRDDERYGEAVQTLDKLIGMVGHDTAAGWKLYYLRGASLERSGKWELAQKDLQHALDLKPDDPEVLNYLGFAWADRGEHLDEALGLLTKATSLAPDSGAIVDSLGWAYYRLGRYPQAVNELERAASLDPADPEINDHLGDAYWRSGRKLEAQYQWRRVLTLEPDAKTRTATEAKLAKNVGVAAKDTEHP
jgi:tetratricopeptide (TPR) repeat protein